MRVLWTISLEYWLRDVAVRRVCSMLPRLRHVNYKAKSTARERIALASNDLPFAQCLETDIISSKGENHNELHTKPEVNTLGDATTVIERINGHKPPTVTTDAPPVPTASPAYDLDE